MTDPTEQRRTDLLQFIEAVYGTGTGQAHVAYGIAGHFVNGKYDFDKPNWRQFHFTYPGDDVDKAIDWILGAAPKHDVYLCPYLMWADKREPGGTVVRDHLHDDWDGSPEDQPVLIEKVSKIRGFAIASGTPGHAQVYVPLAEPVTGRRHRELCEALHKYLPPGSDTKKATNDVLRLPGTWSHKGRALGGESTPVEWLIRPTGARIDLDTLAEILGVASGATDSTTDATTNTTTGGPRATEPVALERYPRIRRALAAPILKQDGTVDRSRTTARVVRACIEAHLPRIEQIRWVVNSRTDCAERVAEFWDRQPPVDDVLNCFFECYESVQQEQSTRTQSDPEPAANGQPRRWKAKNLKPVRQARFLAKNRIPRGAVTILCGDEGIGKSLFWVHIVAAVTTGKPIEELGIPARDPANVILVLTEDDWQSDVQPRLIVAGADLDRIEVICTDDDGTGSPIFPADMHLITDYEPTPALIVVDAWLDTVPSTLMVRDAQQSRTALHPWKDAATKTGAAVMLLAHSNRLVSSNMRDKYGATASLRQKARMTLYALADPGDGTLIVGPDKANSTAGQTKASRFRILGEVYFNPTTDHDGTVPSLQYAGSTGKTIKAHLLEIFDAEQRKARRRTAAEEWLIEFLADGPRKSLDVYAEGAKAEGEFSKDQLKRAKEKVAVAFKGTGDDESWYWELLPDHKPEQRDGGDDDE